MTGYGDTHVGQKRYMNQDYIFCSDTPVGNLPNLYIVADGMGGHRAGDRASSFAVEAFVERAREEVKEHPLVLMKNVIEKVNTDLYQLALSKPEYDGMGTTFVAATVFWDRMYIMNVGDSRLYILKQNLRQITRDHSYVEELVRKGEITREAARNHPRKNVITRAVGVDEKVRPDFFQVEREDVDRVLLCSDGLTNMVKDKEIESILKHTEDIREATEELIRLANENGGLDNISVVIMKKKER